MAKSTITALLVAFIVATMGAPPAPKASTNGTTTTTTTTTGKSA